MNFMKNLVLLCTLALVLGSAFTGCASTEKKHASCTGMRCCK